MVLPLKKIVTTLWLSLIAFPALAEWQLHNEQSSLHFVTTKASHVAEVHRFKELSGSIDENGMAQLAVDLNSVDTNIEIRDQRMKEMLFETVKFPTATFSVQLDSLLLPANVGESKNVDFSGEVSVHGQTAKVSSNANVVLTSANTLRVNSVTPVVVNAKDFGLIAGVEKLREVAGLPSITYSVIVTYDLTFQK